MYMVSRCDNGARNNEKLFGYYESVYPNISVSIRTKKIYDHMC